MRIFLAFVFLVSVSFSLSAFISLNYDGSAEVTLDGEEACHRIPQNAETYSCGEDCTKFSTDEYTSKEGSEWTIVYIMPCDGDLTVRFPAGARLIEGSGESYVEDGLLHVNTEAKGDEAVEFRYSFFREKETEWWPILAVLMVVGALVIFLLTKRKKEAVSTEKQDTEKKLELFPDVEKKIVKILMERDAITQKELEAVVDMPKSTLSRTLNRLEEKGFIERKKVGLSKKIFITDGLKKIIK